MYQGSLFTEGVLLEGGGGVVRNHRICLHGKVFPHMDKLKSVTCMIIDRGYRLVSDANFIVSDT